MANTLKFLFIDDDKRYAEPLIDRAFNDYNIELDHHDNLEEALSCLDDNFDDYKAVIIDGKGKKTKDDKGDDPHHVVLALQKLSERKGKGQYIPYVVLSKYLEVKDLIDQELFFEKNRQEDNMFKYLLEQIEKLESTRIRLKYENSFIAFNDEIIEKKYIHNLLEMLTCLENQDYRKKNLNTIRDLLESFFLTLINNYTCIPESFLKKDNQPNLEWCTIYLEGRNTLDGNKIEHNISKLNLSIPENISSAIRYVKTISCSYSHLNEDEFVKNSFISAAYAMLEILDWLPGFININFEE